MGAKAKKRGKSNRGPIGTMVPTEAAIASALRISPTTVKAYLHLPGAPRKGPKGYDLVAVIEFIRQNTSNPRTLEKIERVAGPGPGKKITLQQLKERELQLKCDRAEFRLAKERGQFFPKKEVVAGIEAIAGELRSMLFNRLKYELPPKLQGLDVPRLQDRLGTAADEICRTFLERASKWTEGTRPNHEKSISHGTNEPGPAKSEQSASAPA